MKNTYILFILLFFSGLFFAQTNYKCYKSLKDKNLKFEVKREKNGSTFMKQNNNPYFKIDLIDGEITKENKLISTYSDNKNNPKVQNIFIIIEPFINDEGLLIIMTSDKLIAKAELESNSSKPCL